MTGHHGRRPVATAVPAVAYARFGFADTAAAAAVGERLGLDEDLVRAVAAGADPDQAMRALDRLAEAAADRAALLDRLRTGEGFRRRLVAVLGASVGLGDHLARHPGDWRALADDGLAASRPTAYGLRRTLLEAVGADPHQPLPWGSGGAIAADPGRAPELRAAYRRQLLLLAARDLTGLLVDEVADELAMLADAALEAALAVAAADLPAGSTPVRLAVIALGKCGAEELNYCSDVDVVFVHEPLEPGGEQDATRTATKLAEGLIRVCGEMGPDGAIFPVDANLRPEGRSGPLVRTIASHRAYYERWARTWEFQALLKARPAAGDLTLGQTYCEQIAPLVWSAADRDDFVTDVQAMRRRVEANIPAAEAGRELKLGRGGLRDVEFAVQLLQLVHGRGDETLRERATLPALAALRDGGYVGRADADELADDYRWLRWVEHRLQLWRLRRTHLVPTDEAALRRLARTTDLRDAEGFSAELRRRTSGVRRLHDKLFYRPLLEAVARLPSEVTRLRPDQAEERLAALGFAEPARALQHLAALSTGISRTAAIQRTVLPVMVDVFAAGADPDAGLLAFRQVSEALGATPWFLRLLRDEGRSAERLALILGRSRYAANLLQRAPEGMWVLADDAELVPRSREALIAAVQATVRRAPTQGQALAVARGLRRVELLRISCADLLGQLDVAAVGAALADTTAATVGAALQMAVRAAEAARGGPLPTRVAVIALGRLGGNEVAYGSDADVVFVHDPLPGADSESAAAAARSVAYATRSLLALPGPDPAVVIDAGLRPEGRQGPLVRSLAAYLAYHARWSSVWESQALLRAAPLAGDEALTATFLAEVADRARFPERFGDDAVAEVRRLKRRVEAERTSWAARSRDLKLGPGGLSDVEWTVQLLQLQHGYELPALRTTGTLAALGAATDAGLIGVEDATALRRAWLLAARARNAVTLVTGRIADVLPAGGRHLDGVARLLGYPPECGPQLLADARAQLDLARAVVARLFYETGTGTG